MNIFLAPVGLSLLLCASGVSAQWQKVYPQTPQSGRWAAVTKIPGGSWMIVGDGMVLRSSDLQSFETATITPGINWAGVAVARRLTGYAVVFTGGSSIGISDSNSPDGFAIGTLPFSANSAGGIACNNEPIGGSCVIAAGSQIIYGSLDTLAVRTANISNHSANFQDGEFFITGYGGGVSRWAGGLWTDASASFADVYNVVRGPDGAGGQHYVTIGDAGAVGVSSDFQQWSTTQPLGLFYAKSVIRAEGRYVAVGAFLPISVNQIAESDDGVAWTTSDVFPGATWLWDVQYFDGTYVAVGDNREIWIKRTDALFANGFE